MRAFFFLPHLEISGGLGVHCRMLLEALSRTEDLELVLAVPENPADLFPKSGREAVAYLLKMWGNRLRLLWIKWPMGRSLALPLDDLLGPALAESLADFCLSSYYTGFVHPPCPQIVVWHDSGFLETPDRFGDTAKTRLETHNQILPRLNALLCISHDARDRFVERGSIPTEKTCVVWHCLTDIDPEMSRLPSEATKASPLFAGGPTINALGDFWFSPVGAATGLNRVRKNLPVLIRGLRQSEGKVKIVVASTGVLDDQMIADLVPEQEGGTLAQGCWTSFDGNLVILPNLDRIQLLDCMASSVGVVYPSRHEGFGLPVIEAMALGLPVVAARSTSIPEIAGSAAILMDPDDGVGMVRAMGRISKDPHLAAQLGAMGRQRARDHFGMDRAIGEWMALFRRVVAEG
ncbi:MAG: glycosyltransferase family 1 protein [Planctomycetota bacterium]|nr:glycosyltransferase family 1 protein [Planctomycetota bacterium]